MFLDVIALTNNKYVKNCVILLQKMNLLLLKKLQDLTKFGEI